MADRSTFDHLLDVNRYGVIATADRAGKPWATPVFFAPLGADRICWVSSPDARHSRNIESRADVAVTVFDSTVPVGGADAAYVEAEASRLPDDGITAALQALNVRLPAHKQLEADDLQPHGSLVVYAARVQHRHLLVRGGDPDHGNAIDMRLEV
ncbi:pyridoxamine 5'-phosphate oxidase family protein [Microbacterium sp. EST19A]|uniref:pyridoxamine 5'-phosphate oxidase family protein n=1 Tax=Microbacterium sp. EST19A TaxID=2862681 RepID=UPI001CBDF8E0|nr:pyridoxamine 5'-phosphate oxidase family protein [Microbacterium sp. EST19A]